MSIEFSPKLAINRTSELPNRRVPRGQCNLKLTKVFYTTNSRFKSVYLL